MNTADTIQVRIHNLLEAQAAAKAIEVTTLNFREVRTVVRTLDRILREAASLGEPTPADTVGADL